MIGSARSLVQSGQMLSARHCSNALHTPREEVIGSSPRGGCWHHGGTASAMSKSTRAAAIFFSHVPLTRPFLDLFLHVMAPTYASRTRFFRTTNSKSSLRRFYNISSLPHKPIAVSSDNQGALKVGRNPIFHARTTHIELHHHFVRERVLEGEISLHYVPTTDQPADIFTKSLGRARFEFHRSHIGLTELSNLHPKPHTN